MTADLHWIDAEGGKAPAQAIIAAYANDKPLYICRADYGAGTHPGQLVENGCKISYGNLAYIQFKYQVLVGAQSIKWKPVSATASSLLVGVPYNPNSYSINLSSSEDIPLQAGYEPYHAIYICLAIPHSCIKNIVFK